VLDARSRGSYRLSHILGARHADLFHYFVPGTDKKGLTQFQEDLEKELGSLGLTGRETAVVYESRFGMRAARIGWMLQYAGLSKVFLLEGGFQAWKGARYPVEKFRSICHDMKFQLTPNSKILATAEETARLKKGVVLDVRSRGEYEGIEARDCDTRRGRVPGASWLEWTEFIDRRQGFRNDPQISLALKEKGLRKNREIVTYCHRGARAAAAYYALRALGYNNVKNYIGSWHEWSGRKELPIEKSV
jgi:thiosulfate/3-mercaptopyruvate sulfurtransferase